MIPNNLKKMITFRSVERRNILEGALKLNAATTRRKESGVIDEALDRYLMPQDAMAREIAEKVVTGEPLSQCYEMAFRYCAGRTDFQENKIILDKFLLNVKTVQRKLTGAEPQIPQVIKLLDVLAEISPEAAAVIKDYDIRDHLKQWPQFTTLSNIANPICGHWEIFGHIQITYTLLATLALATEPCMEDTPYARQNLVDALKTW